MTSESIKQDTLLNQRYLLLEALGKGGMGTVYRAEHVRLHAIVAIKEIRGLSRLAGDEDKLRAELDRCEHEARFLVKLNHPNLPKVTDAFVEQDAFYLVMEYIEGVTLDARLQEAEGRPLDVLQTVEWGLQIVEVLTYLHAQDPPIIFRDLKPSNVMVTPDGIIKLIDFGIARHFQPGASKDTSLLGSVGYSPPEQFGKGQTDPRSDVYALGATLHHLVTGRDPSISPFKFPSAAALNGQVPPALSHLLDLCLSLEPADRPQSANVVAIQLLAIREDLVNQRARIAALYQTSEPGGVVGLPPRSLASNPGSQGAGSGGVHTVGRAERGEPAHAGSDSGTVRRPSVRVTSAQSGRSAPATATVDGSSTRVWAISALLVLLIGVGTAVAVLSGHNRPPSKVPATTYVTQALPVETVRSGDKGPDGVKATGDGTGTSGSSDGTSTGDGTAKTGTDSSGPAPDSIVSTGISLQTALDLKDLATDNLSIQVSGTIKGNLGKDLLLSVYFYDGKGLPLDCSDPSNGYVNEQNYLCTYVRIHPDSDNYTVSQKLALPAHLLMGLGRPQPYSYQAMIFGEGHHLPLYKAEVAELPSSVTDTGAPSPAHPSNEQRRPGASGSVILRGGG